LYELCILSTEAKTNPQRSRNLPEWLERGKPRLLVVPGGRWIL